MAVVLDAARGQMADSRRAARYKFTDGRTTAEVAAFERYARRIEDALATLDSERVRWPAARP